MSRSDRYIQKAIGTLYIGDKTKCPVSPRAPYSVWRTYGALKTHQKYPFSRPEILAPASVNTYKAAVDAGADAIYFGCGELNARATADNFTDLKTVVDYCHLHGVKAYLTLNIMLKDVELNKAKDLIDRAEEAKIDAFIISDLSLVSLIKRRSNAALHASTQMGVHNAAGALFLQRLGFDRVVLSREITEKELVDVLDNTDIEVEIFAHGALCTGFSGACLFSAMLTGKSGNRGRCTQLCRRFYSCTVNGENQAKGYLLSSKDICLADRYEKLASINVDSLKIEGRLKSADYVSTVTHTYSELQNGAPFTKEKEDDLKICFNRGNYTKGYFDGQDVIFPYFPNHIGLRCGRVYKILSKNLVAVLSTRELYAGDCLKASRGMEDLGGLEVTGEKKTIDDKVCYVCHNPNTDVKCGDVVAITKRTAPYIEPRRNVIETAVAFIGGKEARIVASCAGFIYDYTGAVVPVAQNAPINNDDVLKAFLKTNDTEFEVVFSSVATENAFLPKKDLNAMRRDMITYFSDRILSEYKRPEQKKSHLLPSAQKIDGDFAEVDQLSCVTDTIKNNVKNIVYSPKKYDIAEAKVFYQSIKREDNRVFIKFPIFLPSDKIPFCKELLSVFDGAVAQNFAVVQLCSEMQKPFVVGWAMNVANGKNPLLKCAAQTVLSAELKGAEIKKISDATEGKPLLYAFGRLPLMYLNFCPKRLVGRSCAECSVADEVKYYDNKGEYGIFPKQLNGYCQHEMRNGDLTILGKTFDNPVYLDFCGFSKEEIDEYYQKYFLDGQQPVGYNHLLLKNGVE